MRKILENLGTITWFCMDIFWMLDIIYLAYFFMVITIIVFFIPPKRISKYSISDAANFGVWLSTLGWVLMNSSWMFDDATNHMYSDSVWLMKYCSLIIGIGGFLIVLFTDYNKFKNIRKLK